MKRVGIEGIYLGGWATSAKGSADEDPGPDLASYPLEPGARRGGRRSSARCSPPTRTSTSPAPRMTEEQREATPAVDFRPFIIADADTGHGGDAHVRNLIRRFVEVGVPGYHIEDQKPGVKKCGHQGGKVLVAEDEQIKRLNAARFQLDIMQVPGIIVARTDAESATLLDGRSDERDQPFILGATNLRPAELQGRRSSRSCARSTTAGSTSSAATSSTRSPTTSTPPPTPGSSRPGSCALFDGAPQLAEKPAADAPSTPRSTRSSTGSSTSGRPKPT